MWKINLRSIIVALIITIIGIILVLFNNVACVSIGCSLIASAVISILTALIVDVKKVDPLEKWGIVKIYSSRAERNREHDPNIDKAKHCVDGIAFGLSSFRGVYSSKVETCLKKGVNFRLVTMNPNGNYITEREREEDASEGSIKKTIDDLVSWANGMNEKNYKGKIIVKSYDCMTLDFYWRVDDKIFIGPYWNGYKSSDTITYEFSSEGMAFQQYSEYFERLWNNSKITKPLTDIEDIIPKKNRKKRQ